LLSLVLWSCCCVYASLIIKSVAVIILFFSGFYCRVRFGAKLNVC
jgi:hypothetical protein